MRIIRVDWKLVVGVVVTSLGGWLVMPEIGATAPTVSTVIGISLIAVGVSILAGVFE